MRVFLSGDENAARWHLPVAQAKVGEFVKETEKSGLKQNRFTFLFKETGAIVHAQYAFGQVSMQVHAPFIPMVEEIIEEEEKPKVGPKTFWVNTTQGYFWVEVRYADNVPTVILTPFEAKVIAADGVSEEFVYPGFALTAPGMVSGTFDDSADRRYVLSQNGGVLFGAGEDKGSISSLAIISGTARITVVENTGEFHDYVLMQSQEGKAVEVRRIEISRDELSFKVERKYITLDMEYEGEASLSVSAMRPNPIWVHRKCSGSYFSPNKTIGYHVDIGGDDSYLGNIAGVRGGDLLDNTGGYPESMFNHTPDLYRMASLCSFPVEVTQGEITLLAVSPVMGFTNNPADSKKCWGGYDIDQSWASCADYAADLNSWLLAPRLLRVKINFGTGEKLYEDASVGGSSSSSYEIKSWDGAFLARFYHETENSCDTIYFLEAEKRKDSDQCSWTTVFNWNCNVDDPGSSGEAPLGWTPYTHLRYFSRENLRNSKAMYFIAGGKDPKPDSPETTPGFYFLFDGLWHLDVGVIYTSTEIIGNHCGLCAIPYRHQIPGQDIYFYYEGSVSTQWLMENGHEYVENLEVVTPLGYITLPGGATVFGFVAKVPESFAAPSDPVIVTGGIKFKSPDVEGETVYCERSLYTTPCDCESDALSFDGYSKFDIGLTDYVITQGGCPPFEWSLRGASYNGEARVVTDEHTLLIAVEDGCSASVTIRDACGTVIKDSDEYTIDPYVTGPIQLDQGEAATYGHNLEEAVYTGTLVMFEEAPWGGVLMMPENAGPGEAFTASWTGKCDTEVSLTVTAGWPCFVELSDINPLDSSTFPPPGTWIRGSYTVGGALDYCWAEVLYWESPVHDDRWNAEVGPDGSGMYTGSLSGPSATALTCNWESQVVYPIFAWEYEGMNGEWKVGTMTRAILGNLSFGDPC